jgi:hypothetical protein
MHSKIRQQQSCPLKCIFELIKYELIKYELIKYELIKSPVFLLYPPERFFEMPDCRTDRWGEMPSY